MKKSEQIQHELLKRVREGRTFLGDLSGIREFLEAVVEETIEEKAKPKKEQAQVKT
ncbi:MAG: hypothetical protein ACE5R6_19210 [Candidatus Heimdallarchaeota archaeon]